MKTLLIPLSLGGLLLGAQAASRGATSQDGTQPTILSEPVAGSVHVLFGAGGNVAVSVGPDGALLIDDKFAADEAPIRAELKRLGAEGVDFLVNTHWHGDHTGSNAGFGSEAVLIAHANVRARLAGTEDIRGGTREPSPPEALPVITHEHGLSLHFNGEEVRLLSFGPGHTDGDTVVWFTGSKVVHMGDLYFEVGYPFIDLSSGGGVLGLIASVEGVLKTVPGDVKVISGHGRVTDIAALKEYLEMLRTSVERVREALALGETPEEMVAHGITQDLDERWGGFDFVKPLDFISSVAESLGEEK